MEEGLFYLHYRRSWMEPMLLSRPIFIYVNKKSMERPEVKEFVEFYLKNAPA
jgi:ABC-type phosphate transport system substrate-binding protein